MPCLSQAEGLTGLADDLHAKRVDTLAEGPKSKQAVKYVDRLIGNEGMAGRELGAVVRGKAEAMKEAWHLVTGRGDRTGAEVEGGGGYVGERKAWRGGAREEGFAGAGGSV